MTNVTKKRLRDALLACRAIRQFTADVAFADYERNLEKRSAVERQIEIIGEALGKAAASDPTLTERLRDLRRTVALRNRMIHGYDTVDNSMVWDVVQTKVPELERALATLLDTEHGNDEPSPG